jgi:midasin
MEILATYCSWADSRLLSDEYLCAQLPQEILEVIRASNDPRYLDALATATLIPHLTDQLFILYEPLIVDLAARWCHQTFGEDAKSSINVLACFARILPAKPCLKILLQEFIAKCRNGFIGSLPDSSQLQLPALDPDMLSSFLLALFRLYSHDVETYSSLVSPVQLSSLLRHEDPSIRYLTVRCFALYMKMADAVVEKTMNSHLPDRGTIVQVDGIQIHAQLFSLREERRWKNVEVFSYHEPTWHQYLRP